MKFSVPVLRAALLPLLLCSLLLPVAASGPLAGVKIAIDPGHGGQAGQTYSGLPGDPGAVGLNGLREADCVLAIGMRLRDLLAAQGATVYMTRDKDAFVSLSGRTTLANSLAVDRFISIHQNANTNRTPNYTGSHVYTSASQRSIDLAAKAVSELDTYHRIGVVSTNIGVRGVRADNFYVVRETVMPAQLIENSFISNVTEEERLRRVEHLHAAADAIYRGLMTHLGKTVTTDATGPTVAHSPVLQAQEGAAVAIAATITDASGVASARLGYRSRGSSLWTWVSMTRGAGEVWTASIPSALVTTAGLEYHIEAKDALGNTSILPAGSPLAPIQVTVAALPRTGVLTGVITDAATGARLGGVTVQLAPGARTAVTSATGVYRFDDLAAGQYTATGRLTGYADNATARAVEAGSTWWNSFALSPLPQGPQLGDVVITELMWDQLEYIELHNRTTRDISIAGWRITAGKGSDTDSVQVIIDNNAILKAGGYYIAADSGALKGLTVDEIDPQTWAQTGQIVTVWTGKPTDPASRVIDRIGRFGVAWFGGINDATGAAMERKTPASSGTEAASWQTSSGYVGSRRGTAGAANSAGRLVTAALAVVGEVFSGAAPTLVAAGPHPLHGFLLQSVLAAGTYDTAPEVHVALEGPTTVSAGSRHIYTAVAYEGEKRIASQSFMVTFGNGPSATVSRAMTVTTSGGARASASGSLEVAVDRQAGTVTLEVNDPATGASDLEASLASLIRSAGESVRLAIYALDSRLVIDALKAAAANLGSENVRVVMEGSNYAHATYGPLAKELEAAGITVIRDDQFASSGDALMHHKFAVVDDRSVWTGSANVTAKDAYQNANNVLVFRSPDLAAAYAAEFDRMFAGQFGRGKSEALSAAASIRPPGDIVDINRARAATLEKLPGVTPELAQAIVAERNRNGRFVVIEDLVRVPGIDAAIFNGLRSRITVDAEETITSVEALFSPNAEIKNRIVAAIDGARTEIAFAIFTFTDDEIAAALRRAQARGVRVRGVADAWQALAEVSQVNGLREAGLDVKKDGFSGLMHNKFVVIDGNQVLTGSVNWTNSAVWRNDESLLVLKSSAVARKYMAAFEGYYAAGR